MDNLVIVTQPGDWPSDLPGARLVTARAYITDPEFGRLRHARVFNLCRHYRYQAYGYYVSLLAEARGHRPVPTVLTMQDLRTPAVARVASGELEERMKRSLKDVADSRFTLPVYFGRTPDGQYERLAADVFQLGRWLYEQGFVPDTAAVFRYYIKSYPRGEDLDRVHLGLGILLARKLGQPTAAREHLLQAIELTDADSGIATTAREELERM